MSLHHSATKGDGLPFAGLGFDLTPIRLRAYFIRFHLVGRPRPRVRMRANTLVFAPFGYRLLVRLGREIRGR
ncbi:hypothetical protein [Desulfovibrio inopinatus]|uniref:hypothetical protein n=1 Tax=Desulfovibrio inopinatus TaxID=102109 RepID=UPI0005534831|nr:hypothetical protein [Desulfovibrio inopinatus]